MDSSSIIQYTPNSSTLGRRAILSKLSKFAGSDVPLSENERFVAAGGVSTFPVIIASIGIAYNPSLPKGLVLPRSMLARMFGPGVGVRLPMWNDPEIVAANPRLAALLPAQRMVFVVRSGGSGTTEAFKLGVARVSKDAYKGDTLDTSTWAIPAADIVRPGSSPLVVLDYISKNPFTIGFASQADINLFTVNAFAVVGTTGLVTTSANLAHTRLAASLARISEDLSIDCFDTGPNELAWPLVTPTYIMVETKSSLPTCETQRDLIKFWVWTQINPLAIEVAYTVGVTTPYIVLRRVLEMLDLKIYCGNGDLASDGMGHSALPVPFELTKLMTRVRTEFNTVDSKRSLVAVPMEASMTERLFVEGTAKVAVTSSPISTAARADLGPIVQAPLLSSSFIVSYNVTALVGRYKVDGNPLDPLVLSVPVLAGIFSGAIKTWNDPAIHRDNREAIVFLPAQPITVIVRETPDALTKVFTSILAASSPFPPGASDQPRWPPNFVALSQNFSHSLALLARYENSITFSVSSVLPKIPVFPVASSLSGAGGVVRPTSASFRIAHDAAFGASGAAERVISAEPIPISNLPVGGAWPLMFIHYLVVVKEVSVADCTVHAWDMGVVNWVLSKRADRVLNSLTAFITPPPSIMATALLEVSKVRCRGAPVVLDAQHLACPVSRGEICGGAGFGACARLAEGNSSSSIACSCEAGWTGPSCADGAPKPADAQVRNIIIGVSLGAVVLLACVGIFLLRRRAALRPPVWMIKRSDFTLDDIIARGGFSIVFRATWKNTVVTAKVLRLPSKKRGNITEKADAIDLDDVVLETDPVARILLDAAAGEPVAPSTDLVKLSGPLVPPRSSSLRLAPQSSLPGEVPPASRPLVSTSSIVGSRRAPGRYDPILSSATTKKAPLLKKAKAQLSSQKSDADALAGARGELDIIAVLRHPNVTFLIATAVHNGYLYLLLEYMDAGSLFDVLRNNMLDLGPGTRLHMALDAAKGLLFLHSQTPPVLHRDIKSPNVLVDSRFATKITDFGLSSVTDSVAKEGTLPWSAPEVIRGEVYTAKSDVFSFGVLLWEIQCPKPAVPWAGMSPLEVRSKVLAGGRPHLDDSQGNLLGAEFAALIKQCWAELPDDRPTMAAVVTKLEELKTTVARLETALAKDGRRQLLHLELPTSMREDIMAGRDVTPVPLPHVGMIFTDIVGFTKWSSSHTANEVSSMLAKLHDDAFSSICAEFKVHHLETIGDAYIAATSFPQAVDAVTAAQNACSAGLAMVAAAKALSMSIRVGIALGPAVATVVGKVAPKITLLGDTVNLASRLESSAPPDLVQVSSSVYSAVRRSGFKFKESKLVDLKGKGPTRTYILDRFEEAGEAMSKAISEVSSAEFVM